MNTRLIVVFVVLVLGPLIYVLYLGSSLIALIFEDGLRDSVTYATIWERGNRVNVSHPIPKIIHQTWKNDQVPEQWQIAQFTWYDFRTTSCTNRFLVVLTTILIITIWYYSIPFLYFVSNMFFAKLWTDQNSRGNEAE
jgi:hypothetical protein